MEPGGWRLGRFAAWYWKSVTATSITIRAQPAVEGNRWRVMGWGWSTDYEIALSLRRIYGWEREIKDYEKDYV